MKWIKKILLVMVILFALFYLISRPEDAADAVKGVFVALGRAFTAIVTFFSALAG